MTPSQIEILWKIFEDIHSVKFRNHQVALKNIYVSDDLRGFKHLKCQCGFCPEIVALESVQVVAWSDLHSDMGR